MLIFSATSASRRIGLLMRSTTTPNVKRATKAAARRENCEICRRPLASLREFSAEVESSSMVVSSISSRRPLRLSLSARLRSIRSAKASALVISVIVMFSTSKTVISLVVFASRPSRSSRSDVSWYCVSTRLSSSLERTLFQLSRTGPAAGTRFSRIVDRSSNCCKPAEN